MKYNEPEFFSDFIRALKHDLQTPITVLRAYFGTSRAENELVDAAKISTERLTKITAELGKLSADLDHAQSRSLDIDFLKESLEALAPVKFVVKGSAQHEAMHSDLPWGLCHSVSLLIVGAWPWGQQKHIQVIVDQDSSTLSIEGHVSDTASKTIERLWRIEQSDPGYGFWVARLLAEKNGLRLTTQLTGDTLTVTLALRTTG